MEEIKLSTKEKVRIASKKIYNEKIKENPVFYEQEKKRVATYISNRLKTDEEFKEKHNEYMKNYMKERYRKMKELKMSQIPVN